MKQKKTVKIEGCFNYLGEMPDYELPNGVLNKGITGCGATTVALTDNNPTIICSPRIQLLNNKKDQFPDSLLVIGGVYYDEIKNYLETTPIPKILISYDSFHKLNDCIIDKSKFRVVVDEFHYLLQDASFKSEVGLELLNNLKTYPYVTYLSATPILDEYIDKIDFFNDIPYTKYEWESSEKLEVIRIKSNDPIRAAIRIVSQYQIEDYPKVQLNTGEWIVSKECVIFLNSVKNIASIVKKCNLSPDEVNLIIGNSEDNDKSISQLGKGFTKGRLPLEGEKHKKFTFCTSTAYAGCDFYSQCASTFVISDMKRLNTTIDISTDLVQIAGRQRLESNPFRKHIHFIYNISIEDSNDEQFAEYIKKKVDTTLQEVEQNNQATGELRSHRIKTTQNYQNIFKYSDTYTFYDDKRDVFVINELARLNEEYTYAIQKHNYKSGIFVKQQLQEAGFSVIKPQKWEYYDNHIAQVISTDKFESKMKRYIQLKESTIFGSNASATIMAEHNPELKSYYDILGSTKIKSLSYKEANLKKEVKKIQLLDKCFDLIAQKINLNTFISAKEAKRIIDETYKHLDIKAKPKGSDLSNWYTLEVKSMRIDGLTVNGYIVNQKNN